MSIARKLFLLAMTALAAMAFAASTAAAENEAVEVIDEDTGTHCPPAQPGELGGCHITAEGEVELLGHVFGIEALDSDCDIDYEGRIYENGTGWFTSVHLRDHAGLNNCVRVPCGGQEAAMTHWPVTFHEEAGQLYVQREFCVSREDSSNPQKCLIELPVQEVAPHDYEQLNAAGTGEFHVRGVTHTGFASCEVEGQVHMHGTPVEFIH